MIPTNERAAILCRDTSRVLGKELEELDPVGNGRYPAMVLTHIAWKNQYFIRQRINWKESDYFAFAEKRMREMGIINP